MTVRLSLSIPASVKSSYSQGDSGNCIEWAPAFAPLGVVPVRDSKDPNGPALHFTTATWTAFTSAVQGEANRFQQGARLPE
ncbi:DUF397 domain-containing protein [Streptomyces tateyamensis]|uniref:DUF397 domain-containing protein n=1 Tax=Streptomyces tateyamensis TaxID=565073 RepID=A0A2V4N423_9ACTN|nr:DUF397 domain-containing protein [Streptomyces tateyamensis]PYC78591.1 DUF397 domain-containing protein [Streptomyces tateyamensis]